MTAAKTPEQRKAEVLARTQNKGLADVEKFRAFVYQKINCGGCGNTMFPDERDRSVRCMTAKCDYTGIKFKAPTLVLSRFKE